MNCRPGDLAFVIDPPYVDNKRTGERIQLVRRWTVVRVTHLTEANMGVLPGESPLVWDIEEPIPVSVRFSTGTMFCGLIEGLADEALRPLRADGVTDEEVRELYTPSSTKETA